MRRYRNRDAIFEGPTLFDAIALGVAVIVLVVLALVPGAEGARDTHAPVPSLAPATERAAVNRVLRYWTPARMRSARPLDLVLDGSGRASLHLGRPAAAARASFLAVEEPEAPPNSANGRIFVKQGALRGYCSGTAINSPTRQLVLTAGHCVNNGHLNGHTVWSQYLEFVPAYSGGRGPFGAFVSKRSAIFAPRQWTKGGNPDFDLGAFLTHPNKRGLNVADAVGGGATIALGLSRQQRFRTFGYPGNVQRMQGCSSAYAGDDSLTFPLAGPPTMGIRCHWAPGASGGGWLIEGGTRIDGLTSYGKRSDQVHTFGPYFSARNVGRLTAGL